MSEIELSQINLTISSRRILHDISCRFGNGTTALVGRNGAGKTSLMRVIAGIVAPTSGEVRVNGTSPSIDSASRQAYRSGLGWVPQPIDLPQRSRAGEFVEFCAWLGGIDESKRLRTSRAADALDQVHLGAEFRTSIGHLSGGQQRRVMVACALVTDPEVLLLDEPTAGLDPDQREHLHDLLNSIATTRTMIISTHLMEDVLGMCDRVVAIDRGGITLDDSLESVLEQTRDADSRTQMRSLRKHLYGRSMDPDS